MCLFLQEIGSLRNLKHLYLINNQLTGPIPDSFAGLHKLERLAIADNRLSGVIPPFVTDIPNLNYVSTGVSTTVPRDGLMGWVMTGERGPRKHGDSILTSRVCFSMIITKSGPSLGQIN